MGEKISDKRKKMDKLTVRDYITMALFLVLFFIIYAFIGMGSSLLIPGVGAVLMHAICSLFWGTLFILLFTRINKNWVPLSFSVMIAIMISMAAWYAVIGIILGGIVAEVVWQRFDKKKFKTMAACFTIQITAWFIGIYAPVLWITDLSRLLRESYIELYATIKTLLAGPVFYGAIGVTVLCCIIGAFIGKALLKKHFEKAGIIY